MQRPYTLKQRPPTGTVTKQAAPKGILALALTGAIPLTLVGLAAAVFILLFSDDPNVSLIGWFLRAAEVLAAFEALAWLPLWAAWELSNRSKTAWAYVVAAIAPVTFIVLVIWFHHSVAQ